MIKQVLREVQGVTIELIEAGLTAHQNYPCQKTDNHGNDVITWSDQKEISFLLKNIGYKEMYDELVKENNYNIKMIDGALLHMMYRFSKSVLISHRLAFYPSPDLEEYQNNPEIYEQDILYAEIISKQIMPCPIRFDFDVDNDKHVDVSHPKSHLTLGQYKNCRIPVSAPIGPLVFVDFILRNFYFTAYSEYFHKTRELTTFAQTITETEQKALHLHLL